MTRLLSGVVLAGAALAAIFFLPPIALRLIACVVTVLAAAEYLRIAGGRCRYMVFAASALVCWLVSGDVISGLAHVPLIALVIAAVAVLWAAHSAQVAGASAFAPIYIAVPLGMLAAVHGARGWQATLLLIATVVVSDSLQYYSGRAFGRHRLAPAISPNKTIEGAVGGVLAGTIFMAVAGRYVYPEASVAALAVLGLVLAMLGIAGDLFESRLKRQANLKDSSTLIPGHGGVLDRIDALLFAIPGFFVFTRLL